MKRLAVLVVAGGIVLAGCTTSKPVGVSNLDQPAWETITDDLTGRSFRCLFVWRKVHYAGGLTSVCYEPAVQQ